MSEQKWTPEPWKYEEIDPHDPEWGGGREMSEKRQEKTITYVVGHGNGSPRIEADTEINGGRLVSVMCGDALRRLEEMERFLLQVRDATRCSYTRYEIDDFMN